MLFDLAPLDPQPQTLGTDGHRARMRTRLLTGGPDALADHEMLEMVLFLALPRRDTKPLGRTLLSVFGDFASVIAAPPADLMRIDGLGEAGTAALKLVQAAAHRLAKGQIRRQPILANWPQLTDYMLATLAHEKTEQCRVLYLDSANRLLADEILGRGTINHTPVYPREVIRRGLELHAVAFVLAHNHPSGTPHPSREDIVMTKALRAAAQTLGIELIDHLIVAGEEVVSFRQQGLLN